ncbi:MAG: zinc metallopeptidase [Oscillospiraceae bacterium]|nr:zinc metallopeptidase [Oscillospiraceae bacterium]MBR6608674.1 zinc metallopeptidase [Oscillospiraceae bacterium]
MYSNYFFIRGFDIYYLILVIPAVIFSMWAQAKVNSTFSEYSQHTTYSRMTGFEAARRILDANGLRHVNIERVSGSLTDHFDPKANVIRLSDSVYSSPSVAAIGVAAHEAGHAVQYATGYAPIKMRGAILPACQIGSQISWPMIFLGLVMNSQLMINLGLLLFASVAIFQLVTLPVELNASNRAMDALAMSGSITDNELYGVEKVLKAAAMTYVAALAVSLAQLLRLMLKLGNRSRD